MEKAAGQLYSKLEIKEYQIKTQKKQYQIEIL